MVYRFRILFEDFDDVYRDIEVHATHSFHELFQTLVASVSFDNIHEAVIYASDDYWRKGKEIARSGQESGKTSLSGATICDFVNNPHQRFLLIYDQEVQWSFLIELIKITKEEAGKKYPLCSKSSGMAPKQYKTVIIPSVLNDDDEDAPKSKRGRKSNAEKALKNNLPLTVPSPDSALDDQDEETEDEETDNYFIDSSEASDEDVQDGFGEVSEDDDAGRRLSDDDDKVSESGDDFGFDEGFEEGAENYDRDDY